MSVFVTDGDQRATLAVVRALGRAGIPVTVGESTPTSLAGSSRYCARAVQYPSPADPERFNDFLQQEMASGRYRVLIPMTDISINAVVTGRKQLEKHVRIPIPSAESIAQSQDKRAMVLAAQKVGIAVPATYMVLPDEDIEEVARRVPYPVVIKPRVSRSFRDGKWYSGGVEYASNADELIAKYRASAALIPCPLVQEQLRGQGRGTFLLLWDGAMKAAFCHGRLREKPPWGGVSVYREAIAVDRELIQKSHALLESIGWQGVAMVEFKLDERDGVPKLMEVNGRFWGSLQLGIDAGINFPEMLYRLAIGESVAPAFDYKVGTRSRWFLGDLDHLWLRLKHGSRNNFDDGVNDFQAILRFLNFLEPNTHGEIFRWSDPRPGWYEWKAYVRDLLRKYD